MTCSHNERPGGIGFRTAVSKASQFDAISFQEHHFLLVRINADRCGCLEREYLAVYQDELKMGLTSDYQRVSGDERRVGRDAAVVVALVGRLDAVERQAKALLLRLILLLLAVVVDQ